MEKNIKDYAPFYLGCEVLYNGAKHTFVGISEPYKTSDTTFVRLELRPENKGFRDIKYTSTSTTDLHKIKLLLRPLSSMTEEEKIEITRDYVYSHVRFSNNESIMASFDQNRYTRKKNTLACEFYVDEMLWLLSKHFDLFNLIESGLAIDKTTI